MQKQVERSHYSFGRYVDHARFNSFFHQLRLIHEIGPRSLLEIGPGGNFLRRMIEEEVDYRAMDLDPELGPELVAALPEIPLPDRSVDLVCAFQVLEHLPFDLFEPSVREMARVSRGHVVISLPYSRYRFQVAVHLPRLRWRRFSVGLPRFWRTHRFNGEHYWTVGTRGYSLRRVRAVLAKHFQVLDVSSPFEKMEHVFFKLRTP